MQGNQKLAVVSGASQGIGAALCHQLAQAGYNVILLARGRELLAEVTDGILAGGGQAAWYAVDLTDPDAVQKVCEQVMVDYGIPELLINNAGVGRFIAMEQTDAAELRAMMAVPYFAAFDLTRGFLQPMLERNSGTIVFINSPACYLPWARSVGYASARWALRGLSEALRSDLHGSKLKVLHVVAGKTASNYFENNPGSAEVLPAIAKIYGELQPEQVAAATLKGIKNRRREVVLPFLLRCTLWGMRLMPRTIARIVLATGPRRTTLNNPE